MGEDDVAVQCFKCKIDDGKGEDRKEAVIGDGRKHDEEYVLPELVLEINHGEGFKDAVGNPSGDAADRIGSRYVDHYL